MIAQTLGTPFDAEVVDTNLQREHFHTQAFLNKVKEAKVQQAEEEEWWKVAVKKEEE